MNFPGGRHLGYFTVILGRIPVLKGTFVSDNVGPQNLENISPND